MIDDVLEQHLNSFHRGTTSLYLTVLVVILGGIAVLPVIRVGVSVVGGGILRPVLEKHEIRAPAAGTVEKVLVERGGRVITGDTVLVLRTDALAERIAMLRERASDRRALIGDLAVLTGDPENLDRPIGTPRLRLEQAQLVAEVRDLRMREEQARQELARVVEMANAGIVPRLDVEDREFRYQQSRYAVDLAIRRSAAKWQAELSDLQVELRQIGSSIEDVLADRAHHVVVAPVAGTVEELMPLSPGSFVRGGDAIAVISPEALLEAEIYVAPRDVGLLSLGMPVRLHVDAFNHADWGHVPGRVTAIGEDFVVLDQSPMFRIQAELEETRLSLRNGVTGELRKGMTVAARFMVAERTLFQLLRDDVRDWLDPTSFEGRRALGSGSGRRRS